MLRTRQNRWVRRHLTAISYAIVALSLAYWPVSAGNILAKLRLSQADQMSTSQILKASRLYVMPFEQRWSAVPAQSYSIRGDGGQREQPQAERRIEKIPFSCELAFSRLVTKGNFNTRCMARTDELGTAAVG
jgi:hypothetical protein